MGNLIKKVHMQSTKLIQQIEIPVKKVLIVYGGSGVDFRFINFELDTIDSSGSICTEWKRRMNETFPLSQLKFNVVLNVIMFVVVCDVLMADDYLLTTVTITTPRRIACIASGKKFRLTLCPCCLSLWLRFTSQGKS